MRPLLLPLLPRASSGVCGGGLTFCGVSGAASNAIRSVAAVAVAVDAYDVFRAAEAPATQVARQGHLDNSDNEGGWFTTCR